MNPRGTHLLIHHIRVGFMGVVRDTNFADSHRMLWPFGALWGRGILVRGNDYLEAITGPFGTSHSALKTELREDEESRGAFYYGYEMGKKTLYFEYASDRTFDFEDTGVLDAIMASLKESSGPFHNFEIGKVG